MVLRIRQYSGDETSKLVGRLYSVNPSHKGFLLAKIDELFPPQEATETWLASAKTDEDWEVFKQAVRIHFSEQMPAIAKLARAMNELQDNSDIYLLVSTNNYERSYEWCLEQCLTKGGEKIHHTVEYEFHEAIAKLSQDGSGDCEAVAKLEQDVTEAEVCTTIQKTTTEVQDDNTEGASTDSFVALHTHSHYSDGSSKVPDLVKAAADAGHPALALTDHGTMMGSIDLYEACKSFGIKPIIGNECYLEHPYSSVLASKTLDGLTGDYKPGNRFHQIVLAKNLEGYRNLSRLTTWSELENKKSSGKGKAYPLITFEKLKEFSEGLIVTSGCIGSLVPQLVIFGELELAEKTLREYQEVFGEDYYIELQSHDSQEIYKTLNRHLVAFAEKLGIKCIVSPDTHYLKPCDYEVHRILYGIKYGKKLSDLEHDKFQYDRDLHYPDSRELAGRFRYLSKSFIDEAIANTVEVANKVEHYELFRPPTAPEFPLPAGVTPEQHLRALVAEGLRGRFKDSTVPEGYEERLDYELGIIHDMGFDTYFLIVHDYIAWAKSQKIPIGMGRGSAAGSLVAYSLGITGIDPIHHGLLFERFLNPERKSMPDIDTDICQERRGEVIDYVIQRYGRDRVAQIGTVNTLSSKAVVKDVARVLELPIADANAISKLIPVVRGKPDKLAKMISEKSSSVEFRDKYRNEPEFKKWIDIAIALEGNMKTYGTHAAGVVIADIPLTDLVPLMIGNNGAVCTQYTMEHVEMLGFLKMDLLGLKTLTVLQKAIDSVALNKDIEIDLEFINREDPQVFEIFKKIDLEGVFQFESSLPQGLSLQLQPDNLEDISAINALMRPGALDTGMTKKFIESKRDLSKISYDHPDLEPLLNMTYGQAIYQEQILKIVQDMGGFSLGGADLVRRACGKKKPEVMERYEIEFLTGCTAKGYSEELGAKLWSYIYASAEYIFNKSHSMAYGYTAYDCAWFKAYHRAEFMAALISHETAREKIIRYLNSCKRSGIQVLPPNINLSGLSFTPQDNTILFGLKAVVGIGDAVISVILEARNDAPFESLLDLYLRTNLGAGALQTLAKAGALDCLSSNRRQLLESIPLLKVWKDNYTKIPERVARIEESINKRYEKLKIEASLEALERYQIDNAPLKKTKQESVDFIRRKLVELEQVRSQQVFAMAAEGEDYELKEKLRQELDTVGFFVSGNPLDSLPQHDLFPVMPDEDSGEKPYIPKFNDEFTVSCAVIEKEKAKISKAGKAYLVCRLEDHAGTSVKCLLHDTAVDEYGEVIEQELAFTGVFGLKLEDEEYTAFLREII